MVKYSLCFIFALLCFITNANSLRFLSDDIELELYYGKTEHKIYNLFHTYNREVYVISKSEYELKQMVFVYTQIKGKPDAKAMTLIRKEVDDDKYFQIWRFTYDWSPLTHQNYNMGDNFYIYTRTKTGKIIYLKDDGKDFNLVAEKDGIVGEEYKGKIIEATINPEFYSVEVSGKVLAHEDSSSVSVNFSIGGSTKTVNAIKQETLPSGDSLWVFDCKIDQYVSEIRNVIVKIDDGYIDNNFGKNYKITVEYGLIS